MEQTQDKIGKYRLVRHLATGGMAEIWLAEQEGPGGFHRQLVIKRILPHLAQDKLFTQMFLDEARTVAQLTHPNIGQISDLGEEEGAYFIAMEYIEGLDLLELIRHTYEAGERVPLDMAVYMMTQLLSALDYAHNFVDREGRALDIVHRDVTPHNLLVSNDGVVKLVDFGVARAKENRAKTQSGGVKGKFAYMAPEQIQAAGDLDHRADLFGAGVTFYELLTGLKPFGDDLQAVNAILNQEMPDPRAHRPDLPERLLSILRFALAKDRAQRYQSAHDMLEDLEEVARAIGLRLSSRELSIFVKKAQGKITQPVSSTPTGPRVMASPHDSSQISETIVHTLSGTNPGARLPQTNPGDPPPLSGPITPHPPLPQPSGGHERPGVVGQGTKVTMSMAAQEVVKEARSNKVLVMAFFGLVLALGIAGLVITGIVLRNPKGPAAEIIPHSGPVANPSALMHEDGHLIFLSSPTPAKVFYKGEYVGDTRLSTPLRKGEYEITLESADGTQVTRTFKVERSLQTFDFSVD